MLPYFVVIDLDGTITEEGTHRLLSGVQEMLQELKSNGHFLSVCSNNVMAKVILDELQLVDFFDVVVGHSSSTWKEIELMEIWRFYRSLYHKGIIKTKFRLNRVVFVDNDQENTSHLDDLDCGMKSFNSLHEAVSAIASLQSYSSRSTGYFEFCKMLSKEYGCLSFQSMVVMTMLRDNDHPVDEKVFVTKNRTKTSKFHILAQCSVYQRCRVKDCISLQEALRTKLALCKICDYNCQKNQTRKYCLIIS